MKENENQTKQASGLPSPAMTCSTDATDKGAERFTPEQRAEAIIQVLYDDTPPPLRFELRDSIAAEIREAVELEREACAEIAETDSILDWIGGSTGNAKGTAMRISKVIRSRTE